MVSGVRATTIQTLTFTFCSSKTEEMVLMLVSVESSHSKSDLLGLNPVINPNNDFE